GVAATRHTGGSLAGAMPGGATLARAYGSSSMVGPVPFVGRVRRSRHPAYRRLPGWGHARRRYACAAYGSSSMVGSSAVCMPGMA
ncbi:hypothetical protein ACK0BT_26460, partial [Klebsiella pneumoniae]|nr:hypothetical protein [Klebsiella pneumoniae]